MRFPPQTSHPNIGAQGLLAGGMGGEASHPPSLMRPVRKAGVVGVERRDDDPDAFVAPGCGTGLRQSPGGSHPDCGRSPLWCGATQTHPVQHPRLHGRYPSGRKRVLPSRDIQSDKGLQTLLDQLYSTRHPENFHAPHIHRHPGCSLGCKISRTFGREWSYPHAQMCRSRTGKVLAPILDGFAARIRPPAVLSLLDES